MSERVTVVGAGISGLAAALEFKKRGADVTLIEAGDRVGGVIQTLREEGYVFERGPNSFPSSATEIIQLAEELGLSDQIISANPAANVRYLYHRHALIEIPTGPGPLMKTKLFNFRQKARFLMEPFIRARRSDTPESVAHFFARRFGSAPARTLVDAFVSGVYAGDARRIGIRSAFPKLWAMEQEYGSIFKALRKKRKSGAPSPSKMTIQTFRDGLSTLMDRGAERLGSCVLLRRELKQVERGKDGGWTLQIEGPGGMDTMTADRLLLASPSRVSGMLLTKLSPMAADILFDIDHAPIISVHAGFPEKELPHLPEAFGFLAPRPSRLRTLGWLFTSRTFAGRAPEGYHGLNGFIGGANDRAALNASDEALQHLLVGELSLALGMNRFPEPSYFKLSKWSPGLPQYNMGHHRRIEAVKSLLAEHPTLGLAGNYLDGVSLADCIKTGRLAAERLLNGQVAGGAKE